MRTSHRFSAMLLAALLLVLCGCAPAETGPGETIVLTDHRGEERTLPARPQRVVVLQASLADLWLTAGGTVIGVTDDTEEHGLDVGDAAVIGSTKSPSVESILSLKPDLVIYSPDIAGQASAAGVLQSARVALLPAKVDSLADYLFHLELFTALTGDTAAYETYGTAVAAEIEAIRAAVPGGGETPRVLFLRAYSSGVKAKATEHILCDILEELGAVNIAAAESSLLENLSMELILREDPDYILVVTMGSDETAAVQRLEETLFSQPAWQSLTAVREGKLLYLPRELFHYKPNARWAEAYQYVYDILYQ